MRIWVDVAVDEWYDLAMGYDSDVGCSLDHVRAVVEKT